MPFDVAATLPEALLDLKRLAGNYWWSWDIDCPRLFEELSPRAWHECDHNPVRFLQRVGLEDLSARAKDTAFVKRVRAAAARFDAYMTAAGAPPGTPEISRDHPVAYFCAEYGVHESLRIYSGGLGVLAGDHVKSASDINLPLVAIGLFYRMGYMTQRLTADSEQIIADLENDPRTLPMRYVRDDDGEPLELKLQLPGSQLFLRAWQVDVGRVTLYLLDADTPSNRDEDRALTRNLYGGDSEMRLQQEIILGRGGARLLRRLDISPAVFHINEDTPPSSRSSGSRTWWARRG